MYTFESLDLCKIDNGSYTIALPTLFQCRVHLVILKMGAMYAKSVHCAAWGFTEVGIVAILRQAKQLHKLVVCKTSTSFPLFNSLVIAVIHENYPRMHIETL